MKDLKGDILWFVILMSMFFGGWYVGAFYHPHKDEILTLDTHKTYSVSDVRVLEGNLFDVILSDKHRYLCRLSGVESSPPEAKDEAIKWFNSVKQEKRFVSMVPLWWDSIKEKWVVDFIDGAGENGSLAGDLERKGLVYGR